MIYYLKIHLLGVAIILTVIALKLFGDDLMNGPDCYRCRYADFRSGCPPFGVYCNQKKQFYKGDVCDYYTTDEIFL